MHYHLRNVTGLVVTTKCHKIVARSVSLPSELYIYIYTDDTVNQSLSVGCQPNYKIVKRK